MAKPNILFILADDMGYGDLSRFNGGLSQTPVLDELAQQGVCLTQHYAASPVCNPSRASLLTGRYPQRTGSIDTYDHLGGERLSLRERTLPDILRNAGYATGLVGKWHNGTIGDAYHPNRRGFDEFFGFRGGWQYYFQSRLERDGHRLSPDGRYLTDRLSDEAIDFVRRHQKEPFFLHLAYNCPHFPITAPEQDVSPFLQTGRFNPAVSTLYGMIRNMDRNIGRVLGALRQLGLSDNTIVLFTSDNGPDFGGNSAENSLRRFNCNYHGSKTLVYEGGIRLPMIVRWPDGLPGHHHLDAMVHLSDWLPTILAMCDVALPQDNLALDGWNVLPVLRGEGGRVNTRRFWQWNRYYPQHDCNAAMRDGPWKLILPFTPQPRRVQDEELDRRLRETPENFTTLTAAPARAELSYGPPLPAELYNVEDDPAESHDLAGQHPQRVAAMQGALYAWFEQVEADRRQCPDAIFR
jgi:arylsulfatase A